MFLLYKWNVCICLWKTQANDYSWHWIMGSPGSVERRAQETGVGSTKLLRSNHLIFPGTQHVRYTLSPYQVKVRQLLSNGCYVTVYSEVVHMHIHPASVLTSVNHTASQSSGKERYAKIKHKENRRKCVTHKNKSEDFNPCRTSLTKPWLYFLHNNIP